MYSARIHGSNSSMTAILYQGVGAEEQWRKDISRYSGLRHPNLFQLYGILNTPALQAVVFHDDVISAGELLEKYHSSHLPSVFVWACMHQVFWDVVQYVSGLSANFLYWTDCTLWVRRSTGRLCVNLTPPESDPVPLYAPHGMKEASISLFDLVDDIEMLTSISLQDYHDVCYLHLFRTHRASISPHVSVTIGPVRVFCGPQYGDSSEIAVSPDCGVCDGGWLVAGPGVERSWNPYQSSHSLHALVMENGWIRVNSADVALEYRRRIEPDGLRFLWSSWLAQANHIFDRLDITSNLNDYVLIDIIQYSIVLSESADDLPSGYLFLCPLADLQSELPTWFRIPECPAYWSLDASGAERLSDEEARKHGFPDLVFGMEIMGKSWDSSVYAGLHRLQEAKGFDPCSQEVAIELGYSLVQVSDSSDAGDYFIPAGDFVDHEVQSLSDEQHESVINRTFQFEDVEMDLLPYGEATEDDQSTENLHENLEIYEAIVEMTHGEDIFTPSRSWNIVMLVQLSFILILCAFALYDRMYT
ncbi:hypothetical protein B0H19DRAFT_1377830 [Mycena capillaripes]|nr:hypothetical protein B0H19DRAFT_1377830 [Mycena capillaripes]